MSVRIRPTLRLLSASLRLLNSLATDALSFFGLIPFNFNAPYDVYPQIGGYQGLVFLVAFQPAVETISSPQGYREVGTGNKQSGQDEVSGNDTQEDRE